MPSWQNARFLVGDPLAKHKDMVVTGILTGAFFFPNGPPTENFHTFSTMFPNPQIKINEDLIHLQSNPELQPLKNSNFLNSQTSKPNPTNRSSDGLSDFLGH